MTEIRKVGVTTTPTKSLGLDGYSESVEVIKFDDGKPDVPGQGFYYRVMVDTDDAPHLIKTPSHDTDGELRMVAIAGTLGLGDLLKVHGRDYILVTARTSVPELIAATELKRGHTEDMWNSWVNDELVEGGPAISNDSASELGEACDAGVVDVMIDHAPPLGTVGLRSWSVEDFRRVAIACHVSYRPKTGPGDGGKGWGYDIIAVDFLENQYPGLTKDTRVTLDFAVLDDVGRRVAAGEKEQDQSLWLECGACGDLHHFDPKSVRNER